jgi:hypothetical protein
MDRSVRLVSLLRSFRLPVDATVLDLRSAYLRDAKLIHPDRRPDPHHSGASQQFAELQANFEEARLLLEKTTTSLSLPRDPCERASSWPHQFYDEVPKPQSVPIVGLPSSLVYATACSVVSIAAIVWRLLNPQSATEYSTNTFSTSSQKKCDGNTSAPPSVGNASETKDASSYYKALSQLRRTKSRQEKRNRLMPQMRDGIALTAEHVAAEDGFVWHLERCAASQSCRRGLNIADRRGDTPLHHCANIGETEACRTLLRLGADPCAENKWHLQPVDLALHKGHAHIATLLQAHSRRSRTALATRLEIRRHADGLGVMSMVPEGMYYIGPYHSAALRNAVNYAAGKLVVVELADRARNDEEVAEHHNEPDATQRFQLAIGRVHSALEGTDIALEREKLRTEDTLSGDALWGCRSDGASVVGLLVFEPAGSVTPDAPSHWCAIRRGPDKDDQSFYRLDTVRGTYRLTYAELLAMVSRYPAWRVLHRRSDTRGIFFGKT